jgi:hypothetical protein
MEMAFFDGIAFNNLALYNLILSKIVKDDSGRWVAGTRDIMVSYR